MATLTTGKIASVMFDSYVETYKKQTALIDMMDYEPLDAAKLQNTGNTVFYPVQQHRPVLSNFDLSGQEQGIIEQTVPISLGDPTGDLIEQRIDDMRDTRFFERAGRQGAMQQATELNSNLARVITNTGSLYYRFDTSSSTNGFEFASEAQRLLDEREIYDLEGRCMVLNPTDQQTFAGELSGRQTLGSKAERSENAYATGNVGEYVASFDIYKGSYNPTLAATAGAASTTTTADVSLAPEAGSVNNVTNTVTNVDYRSGVIPVTSSASFSVGDWVTFSNSGTPVQSIGLGSKEASGNAMTFKIVSIPDATSVEVFPKPIAKDDAALTALEKAYANIDTQITNGATMDRVNTNTSAERSNIFWAKDSIKMISGEVPWEMMQDFNSAKVLSETLDNGMKIYMIYDGDMVKATFRYRLFLWYGISNFNPMANGVGVTF